jgi:hypothetical protein
MKVYGRLAAWLHSFLTLMLDSEWPALHPGRFTTGERILGANWIGDRVVSGAGMWKLWEKHSECPLLGTKALFLGFVAVV